MMKTTMKTQIRKTQNKAADSFSLILKNLMTMRKGLTYLLTRLVEVTFLTKNGITA